MVHGTLTILMGIAIIVTMSQGDGNGRLLDCNVYVMELVRMERYRRSHPFCLVVSVLYRTGRFRHHPSARPGNPEVQGTTALLRRSVHRFISEGDFTFLLFAYPLALTVYRVSVRGCCSCSH